MDTQAAIYADVMEHLQYLCVELGPRPRASAANHAAASYIRGVFETVGLQAEEQPFPCPAWEHKSTLLELNGTSIEAAANPFSPPCDVNAPTVVVGTTPELERADLSGAIAVMYGDLTRAPLAPKAWFLKSQRDERIIELLEAKAPAAVIAVQAALGSLDRVIEDAEFTIPSATVSARSGLELVQHAGQPVRLRILSRTMPGSSCNLIGRTPDADGPRIVICAHYDTKIETPGAGDNGGGASALLTLARTMGWRRLNYGLELVAFTGEEYLPLGDDEYVRRRGDTFDSIVAAINIDGAGACLGANSITLMGGSQQFQAQLETISERFPGIVWVEPWPESNHSTFAWRGVPSVALGSIGAPILNHQPGDTIEWMSITKLAETVLLVGEIVESIQDRPMEWLRLSQ